MSMAKKIFQLFFMVVLMSISTLSFADSTPTSQLIQHLSQYQQTQGSFVQQILDDKGALVQETRGVFALNRSLSGQQTGQFRWQTLKPMTQLLIADGQKIYFYDPALQQVTIQKQQTMAMKNSPAMLLSGSLDQISANYNVSLFSATGAEIFTLMPKRPTFFHSLKIQFNQEGNKFVLAQMTVIDSLDQMTHIRFSELREGVNPSLFTFSIPKGTDIIHA